jgi:YfiH family protein
VARNREQLAAQLGGPSPCFVDQVHGATAVVVAAPPHAVLRGDALITSQPGLPLAVLVADCMPVLMADPVAGVVAAAHAGRRGLAAGVLQQTVAAMAGLGSDPRDCRTVIGPSVCGRCYEVPAALRDEVSARVPDSAARTRSGTPALDLPGGAARILRDLGVGEVRRTDLCTVEDRRFFSYRRDGVTGRFAGVVMLAQ